MARRLEEKLDKSESSEPGSPLTPTWAEAIARFVLMRAKEGSVNSAFLAQIPELLKSEHVPEALKEQLRAL